MYIVLQYTQYSSLRNLGEGAPMKMDYVNDLGNTQLATNKLCASHNIEVIVIHQNVLQISLTLWLQTWKDLICYISTEDNSGI